MEFPISSVSTTPILIIDPKKLIEIMPPIVENTVESTVELTSIKKENIEIMMLTKEQQEIFNGLYDKAKSTCDTIVNAVSLNNSIKITQIIGQIVMLIEESVKSGIKLSSVDKKVIAMELCRRTIKESGIDDKLKENILYKFNVIGDEMLETIIHISKNVNIDSIKKVQEVITPCCIGLMSLITKKSN